MKIVLNDIFTSIDGEVNHFHQGVRSTFIRFQGCNLYCPYCDTGDSIPKKSDQSWETTPKDILDNSVQADKITITGGEPLMQRAGCISLINMALIYGYKVSVETNGTMEIPPFWKGDDRLSWVVDFKMNLEKDWRDIVFFSHVALNLGPYDFIKIVIGDAHQLEELKDYVDIFNSLPCTIAISPVTDVDEIGSEKRAALKDSIIDFMNKNWLPWVFNVQLHKFLGVK